MSASAKAKWIRVRRSSDLPICGRKDWCLVSPDGTAVLCMRRESDKPKSFKGGGGGWLHSLGQTVELPKPKPEPVPKPATTVDAAELAERMFRHAEAGRKRSDLSRQLGVTVESLERMR